MGEGLPRTASGAVRFPSRLDVVDVDDVTDVVRLQDDLFLLDDRARTGDIQRVEAGAIEQVGVVVAHAGGMPVEAHFERRAGLAQDLDVADVVRRTRIRDGGRGTVGPDAEDAVFEAGAARVVDQRDGGLRIVGQLAIVVPGGHPVLDILSVELHIFHVLLGILDSSHGTLDDFFTVGIELIFDGHIIHVFSYGKPAVQLIPLQNDAKEFL